MNAYILVGGQSSRMGVNKALVCIDGVPMSIIIAERLLHAGCTNVFLVGKTHISVPIPQVLETWNDHHPLYGVETALAHSTHDRCIITPCDVPFVSIETYQRLLSKEVTTVLSTPMKKQPLLGLFFTSKRAQAQTYAQQQRSVMSFVQNEAFLVVPKTELRNINHPKDLKEHHEHR